MNNNKPEHHECLEDAFDTSDRIIEIKLSKDLLEAVSKMSPREGRFIIDNYYLAQKQRIRLSQQIDSCELEGAHLLLDWWMDKATKIENQIKLALAKYARSHYMGQWAMHHKGIGPILAAALLVYLNANKTPHVGHTYQLCGLNPKCHWLGKDKAKELVDRVIPPGTRIQDSHLIELAGHNSLNPQSVLKYCKGMKRDALIKWFAKRPWNATLKTVCYKIGESFAKVSGYEDAFYGKLYLQRKPLETARNECGEFAEQAKNEASRYHDAPYSQTWCDGYITKSDLEDLRELPPERWVGAVSQIRKNNKKGQGIHMLPPGHIHSRACRWVTKIFLSHYHAELIRSTFGKEPPAPYPIAHLGHADIIAPPPMNNFHPTVPKPSELASLIT